MSGFRDLLALVLGWKASRSLRSYYRVDAGQVHVPGIQQGTQRAAGLIHTSGSIAGQIHG